MINVDLWDVNVLVESPDGLFSESRQSENPGFDEVHFHVLSNMH